MSLPLSLLASILLAAQIGWAQEITTLNSNARALGMGDAYTSVVRDSDSLFYNPAGLASVRGFNWKLIDVRAGLSDVDAFRKVAKLNSASGSDYASELNQLYGQHIWTGVGAESAITLPLFGFAVYDHAGATVSVDNPISPAVSTNVVNDYGYAAGVGVPVSSLVQLGMDLKYIKRTGANLPFGASFLADLDSKTIYNNVNVWGTGYAMDFGANLYVPLAAGRWTLSAAWKNLGQTRFSTGSSDTTIPFEDNDVTLGTALDFDLPLIRVQPAIDVRYLNLSKLPLARKLNFGIEVGLPLVDIRAGFHEGYYTLGAGMSFGLFRVDAASYGVELGAYPGQIEDRRYVLEFSMELGVGNFGVDAPGNTSSESVSPSRHRLKVRR